MVRAYPIFRRTYYVSLVTVLHCTAWPKIAPVDEAGRSPAAWSDEIGVGEVFMFECFGQKMVGWHAEGNGISTAATYVVRTVANPTEVAGSGISP
ncbi:MAG TPA: hypothetical protein VEX40_10465 [Mycobacterium sp.]|nr:hypothetical protein [Mycobacterium sp.]